MAPHPIPEATRRFAFASIGITTPEYAEQWKPAPSPTEPERHPEWMDAKALNAAPIVPREVAAGVDCCAHLTDIGERRWKLVCNECGAVVGTIDLAILTQLLGLECAEAPCAHCGRANTFPGITAMEV